MSVMQQIERIDEDCAAMVAAMIHDIDPKMVCFNCGDGRGWTVSVDIYGNPEQVQCPCEGRASLINVYTRQDLMGIRGWSTA